MKIRVAAEDLRQRPLYIATPMFGGQCFGSYVSGLLALNTIMVRQGFRMEHFAVFNESLVTRARNYCVHKFLNSDYTHLMFIDADIEFRPDDVLSLLAFANPMSDKDVICGLYPKKHIRWDKIAAAAKRGAVNIEECGADLVFNPIGVPGSFDLFEPLEVTECGTGFMMIQRRVFETFAKAYPKLSYKSDGREAGGLGEGTILACFETHIEDGNGRYLSEDFNFCRLVRSIGFKVWVAPWIQLNHLGHYKFIGNPQALSEAATKESINGQKVVPKSNLDANGNG